MIEDVVVPKIGLTADELNLNAWHKAVGDMVAVDEVIAELETDKTVNELVSHVGGRVTELLVEEGAEVAPGDVVARIDTEAGADA